MDTAEFTGSGTYGNQTKLSIPAARVMWWEAHSDTPGASLAETLDENPSMRGYETHSAYKTVSSTVCLGKEWPGIQELKFIKEASRWALTRIKVKCWLVLTMLFSSAFHGFEVVISPNWWNEIHVHKVHAVRHLRWSRTHRAFSYSPFYQLTLGNVCYNYSWYSFQMIIRFCTFY